MNKPILSICSAVLLAGGVLAGCNDEADTGIEDLSDVPSFAVHRTDYESAAVALLDGDGKVLEDTYLSSGTEAPGLNAALHGDIALPTTPCEADVLTIVARFGGDYVLEVDLEEDEVMRQVPTQTSDLDDEAAYRANPQDILCRDEHVAFVSRFEPNPTAEDGDLDLGDDIAVIDMEAEEITGRIDLSDVREMVEGEDENGEPVEELAYARPTSIVPVGERFAVVALGRLSETWIAAAGMVGVIDLEDRTLHGTFEIDGLKNCVGLAPVADRDDAVIVECSGYPFGDTASAGLVLIAVDEDGEVHEEAALREQEAPALFTSSVSLGGTRVIAVAQGDYTEETGDQAVIVDLDSGDRESLFETEAPGTIGSGAFRSASGLLLIPDAETGVRLFQVDGDDLEELEPVELDEALPARTVRAIRP